MLELRVNVDYSNKRPIVFHRAGNVGDHNATVLRFELPSVEDNWVYYIEGVPGSGEAFGRTENLEIEGNTVSYEVPQYLTKRGAAALTFVIASGDEIAHHIPVYLIFGGESGGVEELPPYEGGLLNKLFNELKAKLSGNFIAIQPDEPTDSNTVIWIDTDEVGTTYDDESLQEYMRYLIEVYIVENFSTVLTETVNTAVTAAMASELPAMLNNLVPSMVSEEVDGLLSQEGYIAGYIPEQTSLSTGQANDVRALLTTERQMVLLYDNSNETRHATGDIIQLSQAIANFKTLYIQVYRTMFAVPTGMFGNISPYPTIHLAAPNQVDDDNNLTYRLREIQIEKYSSNKIKIKYAKIWAWSGSKDYDALKVADSSSGSLHIRRIWGSYT